MPADATKKYAFDYDSERIGKSRIIHADCLEWLGRVRPKSANAYPSFLLNGRIL